MAGHNKNKQIKWVGIDNATINEMMKALETVPEVRDRLAEIVDRRFGHKLPDMYEFDIDLVTRKITFKYTEDGGRES